MPGVMSDPKVIAYEERTLSEEQLSARAAHPGFWHTVLQSVRWQSVRRLQSMSSSSHVSLHPIETPADLLARQYPSLYIRTYAGV